MGRPLPLLPLVRDLPGGERIVVHFGTDDQGALIPLGVDCQSGCRLWESSYPQVSTDQNMVTPAHHGSLVLLGGENRSIRGLEPRLAGSVWTVHERWHQVKRTSRSGVA